MRRTGTSVLRVKNGLITEELGIDDGVTVLGRDRRVASQVDRILKGTKPADVPYEQVTPRSVPVRANAVIE